MTKLSQKEHMRQKQTLWRYKKQQSDVYLRFTILALQSIKKGQVRQIVEKGNALLAIRAELFEEYKEYHLQKKTVHRKLKLLMDRGEVQKDAFGVYSLTQKGLSNIDYFADDFGRFLLMRAYPDMNKQTEMSEIINRLGMYVGYIFLRSLARMKKDRRGDSELKYLQTRRWLYDVMDIDAMFGLFCYGLPINWGERKDVDFYSVTSDEFKEITQQYRIAFPEFYSRAEDLRLNFDKVVARLKESRKPHEKKG